MEGPLIFLIVLSVLVLCAIGAGLMPKEILVATILLGLVSAGFLFLLPMLNS